MLKLIDYSEFYSSTETIESRKVSVNGIRIMTSYIVKTKL